MLASQAHVRHKYTAYENQMMQTKIDSESFDFSLESGIYREIKGDAKQKVREFLEKHRQG
ncbi:MAG: hypothetical protein COX46_03030 [bacterium (Candidatus Ratteibacteria) CG23_combo_of_CG06-09_8_20_14_all_48_7]|uniref:Uncharacterized protein n=1 Tax=bacterium (Candidatus Ratteibacteria) CG23_combo_of_CG06-09_8_20_14_all_48_7 TaxID=2014292 RepID=A0A2G9YCR1_9BACT|nr:MAG: hypothetical protein COX46_03030 [bacterium (Candidatus Ratteibacteria) CG23_combo_of_CG06-09_8_20_14_all_48_7]